MRYFFILIFLFFFLKINAQFVSPNTGQNYDLDDLVLASSGTVTFDSGYYAIHNDLTISANDSFFIDSTATVLMAQGVLLTSLGHLNFNRVKGDSNIIFKPQIQGQNYLGLRIENDNNSILRNVNFHEAGGVRILNANITIEHCVFNNFDQSNSTGVINLFQASPTISNCIFFDNLGPAFNSGANIFSAPKIRDCIIESNNSGNSNSPQINLGPSGPNDTILIVGNRIIGDRNNTQVGGISASNLLGVPSQNVLIDSNLIQDNRYGITCTGGNINATITRNTILDNNSQNNPNLGGSGINFNGSNTNISRVGNNKISGNLWGITIQGNAQPIIGDSSEINSGYNCFSNNENMGTVYALYNNTPNPIQAQLNDWDDSNPENVIVHEVDISSLGTVDFSLAQIGLENFDIAIDYKIINDTIYFSNQTFGNISGVEWLFPAGERYYQLNPIHPIQPFGALNPFIAYLELRGDCSTKDSAVVIDLTCGFSIDYPAIEFNLDANNSSITFLENITGDSANASLNYLWSFGDGNFSSDSAGVHNYDSSGNFILTLEVSNQCGDTLVFTDSVIIQNPIAIENIEDNRVEIYPNPFYNRIHLKASQARQFEIINLQGKIQTSGIFTPEQEHIDLEKLESGMYFIKIHNSDNLERTQKIIKR